MTGNNNNNFISAINRYIYVCKLSSCKLCMVYYPYSLFLIVLCLYVLTCIIVLYYVCILFMHLVTAYCSTQHNAQMKSDIHMLVMNNVMHIKAKDNTKKRKDYPLFPLWSLTDNGMKGMVMVACQ